MKTWPDFNDDGDLPVGVHRATLGEVIEHFGAGTLQRRIVAQRLTRLYDVAHGTGQVARFIIYGSFTTAKPSPNDVGIFLLMEDTFDLSRRRARRPYSSTTWRRKMSAARAFSGCGAYQFWTASRN